MHVPAEAIRAVAHALVVTRRLVLELAHRHQFLEDPVRAVAVGHRVFVVDRNGHRQQVAVELCLVAVAVDDGLKERRPADFHVVGQTHEALADALALLGRHQVVTPVVDQRAGVDCPPDLARDVQQVVELDGREVVADERHRLVPPVPVAGHQVNERLGHRGGLQRGVVADLRARSDLERERLGRPSLDLGPERGVLAFVEVGPDLR